MALTIVAVNLTNAPVFLTRLGLTVPASDRLTLTDFSYRFEIQSDESLISAIESDQVILNLGQADLTKGESLQFFRTTELRFPVRALAYENIAPLSGTGQDVDDLILADGDRVLLVRQSDPIENGVWLVQSGAWMRPDDFGVGTSPYGALVVIGPEGSRFGGQLWQSRTIRSSDAVGTSPVFFKAISKYDREVSVLRDLDGVVVSYTNPDATWVITRDVNGRVVSVENGAIEKTILRDSNGAVVGVEIT
jgi:hypothetical protein